MNQSIKQHSPTCPSHDDLRALLGGSLDEIQEQSIESHVATCQLCGQTLEELCRNEDADRWQKLAGQSGIELSSTVRPTTASPTINQSEALKNAPAIEGYEILSVAGKGGMGVVYRAKQISLNRNVALKMLHSAAPDDLQRLERFRNEADSIASIHHPNVVSIFEISEHEDTPFIVLEYIHGPNLAQLIKKSAPFDSYTAAQLIQKIALAVDAAHSQNLIHRDLKPANIMMQVTEIKSSTITDLKEFEPKITDFGLAKSFEYDNKTRTSVLVGTPSYMAPEQISCPDDWAKPAVDVYALGVILYELLTGRIPFEAKSTFELFKKIETHDPPPVRSFNRGIPKDLEAICLKCLEKNPLTRYASTKLLADDLDRFLRRQPVTARKSNVFTRVKKWASRNRLQVALGAVLLAAAVSLGSLMMNVNSQRKAALADYHASMSKAKQLFKEAKESDLRDLQIWAQASEAIMKAVDIREEIPQITDKASLLLFDDIDYHRSAREMIHRVDELLLNHKLEYYRSDERGELARDIKATIERFGWHGYEIQLAEEKIRALDPTTFDAVVTTIYRTLLLYPTLQSRDWFEELVQQLDGNDWRKSAYKAATEKDEVVARQLIDQPDLTLPPTSLADLLTALELDGLSNKRRISESLKAALLRNPSSFWLNFQLAIFIRQSEHTSNAIPYARAAMAQRQSPEIRLWLGRMYYQMREYDLANQEYMVVLEQHPHNTAVYRQLAECCRRQKNFEGAIENYRLAIELEPERDFVRGALLETYIEAGQKETGKLFAEELIARETTDHETFHSKAIAFTKLGKLDLAIENFELAIDADPQCVKCMMELASVYLRKRELEKARTEMEKFLVHRPNLVEALKTMMQICLAQKDFVAAEHYAKQRLAVVPHSPGYISDLADIYVKAGKFDLAEEAYIKSQSFVRTEDKNNIDKDNVYALERLAILYNQRNKLELAETTARRAIRINPTVEQPNFLLVQILCQQDRLEDALNAAKIYVENLPESLYSHASVLNTLVEMKRFDEAIQAFHVGKKFDSDPPKFFTDGQLKRLKKMTEEARSEKTGD